MASTPKENIEIENRELTCEKGDNAISAVHNPILVALLSDCIKTESINEEAVCRNDDKMSKLSGDMFVTDVQNTEKLNIKNTITAAENSKQTHLKVKLVNSVNDNEVIEQVAASCGSQDDFFITSEDLGKNELCNKNASDQITRHHFETEIQTDIKREGHCTELTKITAKNGKHTDKKCSVTSFSTAQNIGKSNLFEDTCKYICDHCSMQFVCKETIERHIRLHFRPVNVKPFVCQFCKMYFSKHKFLRFHNQRFHLKLKYECPDCKECFVSVCYIQKHTIMAHKLPVRHCIPCDKIFKQSEYKQHQAVHRAQQNTCSVCNIQFNHKAKLVRHMDVHERDNNFPCEVCMKAFKSSQKLKSHQLKRHRPYVVKTEKNYSCHVCGKLFKVCNSLTTHLKIHDSEKRFMCDKCDKKFTFKHQLENHMTSHSEVRNNVCDTCGAKFKMPHHLRNHIKTHVDNIQ